MVDFHQSTHKGWLLSQQFSLAKAQPKKKLSLETFKTDPSNCNQRGFWSIVFYFIAPINFFIIYTTYLFMTS